MRPRRVFAAALLAGLLLPGAVQAAALSEDATVEIAVLYDAATPVSVIDALNATAGARVTGAIEEVGIQRVVVEESDVRVFESSPWVRALERPRTFQLMGAPNDPLVKLQWGLKAVGAFDAWRLEEGKKSGVMVGVIDTGIDATHADLKKKVEAGFDFLELDADPYDDNGHGTHVAGIIAANVGNKRGVAGLAPGVSVIPMKACLSGGQCDPFAIWAGVVDATRRGAAVLNLSLGGSGECDDISQAVFDWVHDQGTLTVAAAGNSGSKKAGNPTISPANCDHTLVVGAIDQLGRRALFSSYGDFVDIAAPGVEIWSTLPPIASLFSEYLGYGAGSGTSMAAPHVAAAAALVKARHPEWTPDQIQVRLLGTATDVGRPGRDDEYGEGTLNLFAALR
ncbi:MAG TPA: S8 family serine peptidase [Actinomycetota bacterium]|nr:S8 family serine peptidase [Actinomycetota bacterium]